jgi:hypothetical protein
MNDVLIGDLVSHVARRQHDIEIAASAIDPYNSLSGAIDEATVSSTVTSMKSMAAMSRDHWPRSTIDADANMLSNLIGQLRGFTDRLFPRSLGLVFGLLGWLCVVSIIWPLVELPARSEGQTKTLMLVAFTMGLAGFGSYFWYQLHQITRLGKLSWPGPTPADMQRRRAEWIFLLVSLAFLALIAVMMWILLSRWLVGAITANHRMR